MTQIHRRNEEKNVRIKEEILFKTMISTTLNNIANKTIMFSNRPERIVTSVSTSNFIGNWTTGSNSFAADAPKGALIVKDTQTGNLKSSVIESFDPVYDTTTITLTYTIIAENETTVNLPSLDNRFCR